MPEESGVALPNPSAWLGRLTRSILGEWAVLETSGAISFIKKPS